MMRVGFGYDIHRLEPGRPLILGGVRIPSAKGLAGHSDADVIIHSLMDSLLGAAGLRDIGTHFPPGDDRYQGASSVDLLATVNTLLERDGWAVINTDVTVIAEEPRLAPHIGHMIQLISETLGVDPTAVSIKATTNEGVGPEGRREAISAHAVALIERP